jgi:hypothetical protein
LDNNGRFAAEDVSREIVDVDLLLLRIDRIDSVAIREWGLLDKEVPVLPIHTEKPSQDLFDDKREYRRFLFDWLSRLTLHVTSWDC